MVPPQYPETQYEHLTSHPGQKEIFVYAKVLTVPPNWSRLIEPSDTKTKSSNEKNFHPYKCFKLESWPQVIGIEPLK